MTPRISCRLAPGSPRRMGCHCHLGPVVLQPLRLREPSAAFRHFRQTSSASAVTRQSRCLLEPMSTKVAAERPPPPTPPRPCSRRAALLKKAGFRGNRRKAAALVRKAAGVPQHVTGPPLRSTLLTVRPMRDAVVGYAPCLHGGTSCHHSPGRTAASAPPPCRMLPFTNSGISCRRHFCFGRAIGGDGSGAYG